jgi:NAD+ synthase
VAHPANGSGAFLVHVEAKASNLRPGKYPAQSRDFVVQRDGLQCAVEADRIANWMRAQLTQPLSRRGYVVAMSGGVDSSTCAALAVRAVGPARVLGVMLPERDSDPRSLALAVDLAHGLGIEHVVEDIAPALAALGCYRRRDDAIRRCEPAFADGWRCKLVLGGGGLNVSSLVVQPPGEDARTVRLTAEAYRDIVAATNFKQRVRTMLAYYHADRRHFAVVGTPNRLEYDQGFFVKGGDGLADVKPIAHLLKGDVVRLATYLGVPEAITARPPTTDTFSLPQSQDEFYFGMPAEQLDAVIAGLDADEEPAETARRAGLTEERVRRARLDVARKRAATRSLHVTSLLVEPVPLDDSGVWA